MHPVFLIHICKLILINSSGDLQVQDNSYSLKISLQ